MGDQLRVLGKEITDMKRVVRELTDEKFEGIIRRIISKELSLEVDALGQTGVLGLRLMLAGKTIGSGPIKVRVKTQGDNKPNTNYIIDAQLEIIE